MAQEKNSRIGLFERIAHGYFYGEKGENYIAHRFDEELSDAEWQKIKKIRLRALILSAIAGTLGVLLLYLPPHFFPAFFSLWTLYLHLFGSPFELPLFSLLYGIILAVAEIYYLVYINIRAVHRMAIVCGFPSKEDPDYDLHVRSLVNIGVEKNAKNELGIGLDPWQGYSKYRLLFLFVWNRIKASLSNVIFKMLVRRIMGRYAVRVVVDLAGVPVMATWNAYASNSVLRNARVRILAPSVIQSTTLYLHRKYANDEQFRELIYDILQYLAVKKRSFHENHYLLSVNLLKAFGVTAREKHLVDNSFYEKLRNCSDEMRNDIGKLLVIGIIIDGSLSRQEIVSIKRMNAEGLLQYNLEETKTVMRLFSNGKGLTALRTVLKMEV